MSVAQLASTVGASQGEHPLRHRIAFDGHMIGSRETGNETYAAELAGALGHIGGYEYLLYTPRPEAARCLEDTPHLALRTFRPLPSALRIPCQYPRLLRADRACLLHVTYVAPPVAPCPVVVTVHDVSFRRFPEYFSWRDRLVLNLLIGPSIRRAARVITISEFSRGEIARLYRIAPERIEVTPLAAGAAFKPSLDQEGAQVRRRYALLTRYILAVGNIQPRKNLPRLVAAFASIAAEYPDYQLVVVGQSAWRGSEVEAAVRNYGLEGRVRFTGYVSDEDLVTLYSGATAVCYPSLYEGFGLPPLEAMACGTPTITSKTSSLPEVVGDAALTVDPSSIDEIAAALHRIIQDDALRAELRRRGLARAAGFSWERTARRTKEVYDRVLEEAATL